MKVSHPIRLRSIRKTYGEVVALDIDELDIQPGEFLTVLGPSGSGKSTLLMVLAGFVRPDSGSVLVNGREFVTLPPHQRDVGLVFQNYALFPHMTVAQNVAFPLRYRKVSRKEVPKRVQEALRLVRLDRFESRRIDELSGGQRQRVALARALVFNPTIMLMDEPLSALDKKLRERMQIELKHLHSKVGATTLYVTHDQREALTLSDRIAVMNHGQIVQIGTPEQIYERPESLFVADFLGDSQFVRVERHANNEVRLGNAIFKAIHVPQHGSSKAFLLLRPEKLELLRPGINRFDLNLVGCRVREVIYQGEQVLIIVALPTGEIVTVRRGTGESVMQSLPKQGDELVLGLHPKDTVVVADA
jgi:putative spermidine/putrescine transport system ATP-binding protein